MPAAPTANTLEPPADDRLTREAAAAGTRRAGPSVRAPITGLVWTLIRTDFKTRYHGSAGGFLWALLKPLSMFVVLMLVFSLVFGQTPTYKLNLIIGLFLWDFFAQATTAGLVSLYAKSFLLTKARCPSWILVVTSMSNALITLAVFCVVILAFLAAAGRVPNAAGLLAFFFDVTALIVIVAGFSLATSVLFLRYRDLNQVWEVVVQAGFFVAPVVYPLGIIPERYHIYLYLWPPTPVIEFSRAALVTGVLPTLRGDMCLGIDAVVFLAVGVLIFRRLGPRAAEYL